MRFRFGAFLLCSTVFLSAAFCAGSAENITGVVRLVGNMPFPELVLTDDEGRDWFVLGRDRELLESRVRERVTVRGTARSVELHFANGPSAGTRLILENITIIE